MMALLSVLYGPTAPYDGARDLIASSGNITDVDFPLAMAAAHCKCADIVVVLQGTVEATNQLILAVRKVCSTIAKHRNDHTLDQGRNWLCFRRSVSAAPRVRGRSVCS